MDSPVFKTYTRKGIIFAVLANILILISLTQLIKAEADKNEKLYLNTVTIATFRPNPPPKEQEIKEEEPEKKKKEIIKQMEEQLYTENIEMDISIPQFEINTKIPGSGFSVPQMHAGKSSLTSGYDGLINLDKLDRIPVPKFKRQPVYPYRAKRMGIEGEVSISFIVDKEGKVSDIKIIEAVPKGIFEKSVIESVSSWRYAPGELMGKNVRTLVKTKIIFKLEN